MNNTKMALNDFDTPFADSGRHQRRVKWPVERKLKGKTTFREKALTGYECTGSKGFRIEQNFGTLFGVSDDAARIFVKKAVQAKLIKEVGVDDGTTGYIWLADPNPQKKVADLVPAVAPIEATIAVTAAPEPTTVAVATTTQAPTEETLREEIAALEAEEARLDAELKAIKAHLLAKHGQLMQMSEAARKAKMSAIIEEIAGMSSDELRRIAAVVDQQLQGDIRGVDLMAPPTMAPPAPRRLHDDDAEPNVPEAQA